MAKIVLVTRQFDGVLGGLERQIAAISFGLEAQGHNVAIAYIGDDAMVPLYEISPKVKLIRIGNVAPSIKASWRERLVRQIQMNKAFRKFKPEVCIAFMTGGFLISIIPSLLHGVPCILSERNSPGMYKYTSAGSKRRYLFLIMKLAKKITVQFPDYIDGYPRHLRRKMVSIPNSVSIKAPLEVKQIPTDKVIFLFSGRFSFQKQPLLLAKSFSRLELPASEAELRFYGSGELEKRLQELILNLDCADKILVLPPASNIIEIYENASVTCVPSLWEGFPNTVLESLYCGRPVVGFAGCDGLPQLINDGKNGWLALGNSSEYELTRTLYRAYQEIKSNRIVPSDISASVSQYNPNFVYKKWNDLIHEILTISRNALFFKSLGRRTKHQ